MSSIYLAGAVEAEWRKGIAAIFDAIEYLDDLRDQYMRWEDEGGIVGDIPHCPRFPS